MIVITKTLVMLTKSFTSPAITTSNAGIWQEKMGVMFIIRGKTEHPLSQPRYFLVSTFSSNFSLEHEHYKKRLSLAKTQYSRLD